MSCGFKFAPLKNAFLKEAKSVKKKTHKKTKTGTEFIVKRPSTTSGSVLRETVCLVKTEKAMIHT